MKTSPAAGRPMTRSTATSTSEPDAATVNTTARIHRTREDSHPLPCRTRSGRPGRGAGSLMINTLQRISSPWTKTYASGPASRAGLGSFQQGRHTFGVRSRVQERTHHLWVGQLVRRSGGYSWTTGGDHRELQVSDLSVRRHEATTFVLDSGRTRLL